MNRCRQCGVPIESWRLFCDRCLFGRKCCTMSQNRLDWIITWGVILMLTLFIILCVWCPKLLGQSVKAPELPRTFTSHGVEWKFIYHQGIIRRNDHSHPGYQFLDKGYTCCPGEENDGDGCVVNTIELAGTGDRCDELDTVYHELQHVAMCGQNFEEDRMSGHYAITVLSRPMAILLGNNPAIMQYMAAASIGCK